MDDTARSDQNQQAVPAAQGGGRHKEQAFVTTSEPLVRPSIPEVLVPPELREHGIEVPPDIHAPQLDQKVQAAGVQVVSDARAVPQMPAGTVTLPLTLEQAEEIKKTTSWKDAIRWLAELILEQGRKRLLPETQS